MIQSLRNILFKKPFLVGLLIFLLVLFITQFLTFQRYLLFKSNVQEEITRHANSVEKELQNVFNQGFNSTQTLAFLVENYGVPDNFDSIASVLLKTNDKVDALELVDGVGTITHVYPLRGNEVVGFNILQDSIGKSGANKTIKRKDYFLTGPIPLKQGGSGFVSRTPIFLNEKFKGFTAAVIKLPSLLSAIPTNNINKGKYSYQLTKINENGGEEVFFSSNNTALSQAYNIPIGTRKGEWKLYVILNNNSILSTIFIFGVLGFLLAVLGGIYTSFLLKQPIKLNRLVQQKTALLRNSNKKYKSLIEQASDGIFLTDYKGNIIDVNPIGAEMFGYVKEELLRKNLNDLSDSQELSKTPLIYAEIAKGNAILNERKLLRKDGSVFYGEINAKKLNNTIIQGIVRDTTIRKKLELQAQNNLQKFSKAFNNNIVGMVIMDRQRKFIDANAYFLNLIGWSLKDLKGKTLTEIGIITENFAKERDEYIVTLELYGKLEAKDVIFRSKTGEALHLLASSETYNFNNEKYILSTFIDRTEARKDQYKIKQSEAKYRELTERISDAFVAFDKDWTFTYVNTIASKIILRKPEELIGKNLWEEFPDFAKSKAYPIFVEAYKNQKYKNFEQYHDQFDTWIANHIYPSPEGLTIYFKDITKKKKADIENQKLISIIENSPGFIGLATLDGQALYLNESGRKMTGLVANTDITKKSISDFFPEHLSKIVQNERLPEIKEFGIWNGEVQLMNFETKNTIPVAFSGFLIKDKITKEPIGIGSLAFDQTDRKNAKERLEAQNKELKKTNSELDSFVYSASHELRAPLTSILGLVNIIKIDENKPELIEKLTMMENSIKRLDNFIRDIIEFSRNRHLELSLEKINFCNLIDDSLESLWYLENTSNITIIREISSPVDYYSDKRRIAVILNNFIELSS